VQVPILVTCGGGTRYVIEVTCPLTPHYSGEDNVRDLKEFTAVPVLSVDETVVRKNLPWATSNLLNKLGLN
jgi:hypothetical protein